MEQRNYSAYRFAKILGVNIQSPVNWKTGASIPHYGTQQKIAEHFGITLAELDGDELPVLPPEGAKKAPDPEIEGKDEKIKLSWNKWQTAAFPFLPVFRLLTDVLCPPYSSPPDQSVAAPSYAAISHIWHTMRPSGIIAPQHTQRFSIGITPFLSFAFGS